MLNTTPGLTEVTSDLTDQRPLLKVVVNRTKAARLGFTQAEVGQAIANALRGTEAGTVVLEGETRDIMVRPQEADEASPDQVAALELPVSQLQQQQAVDRATKELEDKQDELTEDGDALTEAGEDLADDQEALGDRQQAAAEEQQDKAVAAAADQRAELRKALREARDGLADARRARNAARVPNPGPPPAPPTAPTGLPADQAQVRVSPAARGLAVAVDAYRPLVSSSTPGSDQAEAQVDQLNEQTRRRRGAGRGERGPTRPAGGVHRRAGGAVRRAGGAVRRAEGARRPAERSRRGTEGHRRHPGRTRSPWPTSRTCARSWRRAR